MTAITTYPTNNSDAYQDAWAAMGRRRLEFGVFRNYGEEFAVSPSLGLELQVGTGAAAIEGIDGVSDSGVSVTLAAAHPTLPRNDLIVASLHKDDEAEPYVMEIEVLTGTPSSTVPLPLPALRDSATRVDIPIAYCYVGPTSSAIVPSDIHMYRKWAGDFRASRYTDSVNAQVLMLGDSQSVTGVVGPNAAMRFENNFQMFSQGNMRAEFSASATAFEGPVRIGDGIEAGGSGPYLEVNPFNVHVHFSAIGPQNNIGMRFSAKGTSGFEFYANNDSSRVYALIDQAGNVGGAFETGLAIRSENVLKRVYIGEVNSGGTGYRVLRMVN